MIVNNSQNIQSSPLDSISTKRIGVASRSSSSESEDNKQVEKVQKQQDLAVITQLRTRDREVRAHEAAHVSAGGSFVRGGPSFTYQKGPDGRSYAIGGEVQLDVSAVANDPQATLTKASIIRNAALAPAEPSAQDRRVASNANQLASRARVDLAVLRREETQLSQKQGSLETETQANDSSSNESGSVKESAASISSSPSRLKANDVPIAAISAFMTTAQPEAAPVRFSQFA